jgi:hypothetical protein
VVHLPSTIPPTTSVLQALPNRTDISDLEAKLIRTLEIGNKKLAPALSQILCQDVEASMRRATTAAADKHDIGELRALLLNRLALPNNHLMNNGSAPVEGRILLVMNLPHLTLSKEDLRAMFQLLSKEVCFVADAINTWLCIMFAFLVLALPHVVTALKLSRRIPATVSLILHDNEHFEDALGRQHSLQFNQFRYWSVFHAFLDCVFTGVPGHEKLGMGSFILVSEDKHLVRWTDANYDTLIQPGCSFKMFIMLDTEEALDVCPRCSKRSMKRVSRIERRCSSCDSVILTQMQSIPTLHVEKRRPPTQARHREMRNRVASSLGKDGAYRADLATFKHVHIRSLHEAQKPDPTIGQSTLHDDYDYDRHKDDYKRAVEETERRLRERRPERRSERRSEWRSERPWISERHPERHAERPRISGSPSRSCWLRPSNLDDTTDSES